MNHIPYVNYVLKTELTRMEVIHRLKQNIDPPNKFILWFSEKKSGKNYHGRVNTHGFEIIRQIEYRNSFIPITTGKFENSIAGTIIHIKMQMALFVRIFELIWFGIIGLFLVYQIVSQILNHDLDVGLILIPLGMLTFGYSLTLIAFNYEAAKTKEFLGKLFKSGTTQPINA